MIRPPTSQQPPQTNPHYSDLVSFANIFRHILYLKDHLHRLEMITDTNRYCGVSAIKWLVPVTQHNQS